MIADGPPSRVVEEVVTGRITLVLPEPVTRELVRVLVDKFGFSDRRRRDVEAFFGELARERPPAPAGAAPAVTGDPADDIVLACAVAAGVDVLVSGDRRHLLPVGSHRGVRILAPQALLAELVAANDG